MMIIGALMIGIGFMFRTWVTTVKDHSKELKDATDTYREDVKEITTKQDTNAKEISDKFIALQADQHEKFEQLHRDTIARIMDNNKDGTKRNA